MKKNKTLDFGQIFNISLISFPIVFFLLGCKKNANVAHGPKKTVEGIVYEDCNGNVAKGRKLYLYYGVNSCFGGDVISKDSTVTDHLGHYCFKYRAAEQDGSTSSYYHQLVLTNSLISIINPSGNYDLFPNDTLMTAVINLKFTHNFNSSEAFYCEFKPSPKGYIEAPEQITILNSPLHDTTILFHNLRIGNINSVEYGLGHCGEFKWGLGKDKLNSYNTGKDGSFHLTHKPCSSTDTFYYDVEPK
ncbi:MAG: hypothetical protein R2831_12035 [Chitinophagaceae bacterium]